MSEGSKAVNEMYNDIREVLKMDDGKERNKRLAGLLTRIALNYEGAVQNIGDKNFMDITDFAGFSLIALMFGAESGEDPKNLMSMVLQIVIMCTSAINNKENHDGEE